MKLLIFCAVLVMCIAQLALAAPEPDPIFFIGFGGREGGGWGRYGGYGGYGGWGGYGGGWGREGGGLRG